MDVIDLTTDSSPHSASSDQSPVPRRRRVATTQYSSRPNSSNSASSDTSWQPSRLPSIDFDDDDFVDYDFDASSPLESPALVVERRPSPPPSDTTAAAPVLSSTRPPPSPGISNTTTATSTSTPARAATMKQAIQSSPKIKRQSASQTPAPPSKRLKLDAIDVIDMVDVDDDDGVQKLIQQQMLKSQAEDDEKRKISDFKCVICLDDPTILSSTPCGHLFCNECIKTTLRFGQPNTKHGRCPVCRGKVVIKDIVPLELKVLRTKGKGKAAT